MIRIRFLRSTALGLALCAASPAFSQNEIVANPNPDADRLAGEVRRLAADPRDTLALLDAGDLSARLGDTSAALAFFARAEALDPTNPRILSGRASTLVRLERPGEALRLFQQAEARGLRVSQFASDRGWAYDLLGVPDMAQRDYRTALAAFRDDETVRRYALSLGITGDVEQAMKELDPLLRRTDRAAWRARAFILAMNGDVAGADKIAGSMMPANMGASLGPFFRRLANLAPSDRAFAVHFGELSPTQARLADARMAPQLPSYVARPRPIAVSAAPMPVAAPAPKGRDRRSRRERERDERLAAAVVARTAPAQAAAPDLPAPPRYVERQEIVQAIPAPTQTFVPAPTPAPAPVPSGTSVRLAGRTPLPEVALTPERTPTPAPAPVPRPAPVQLASSSFMPAPQRVIVADIPPQRPVREAPPVAPASTLAPTPAPAPSEVGKEDSVLASIIGGISIPAEELAEVTRTPDPLPAPEPVPAPAPEPEPVRVVEAKPKPVVPVAKPKVESKAPKVDPKLAKLDPKAKKADPKKVEPKKADPAKTDPSRAWVQVAGGANPDALAKAWNAVVAKAPALMKGKAAWSTPLRATNRVLAGPFKSSAEAQAFVNTLGKSGVSAFVFTSEAGQKVTKLTVK